MSNLSPNDILDKTLKGQEEIQGRKYKLPAKSRMLLLLVDGQLRAADLTGQAVRLGVPETALSELLAEGFIAPSLTSQGAPSLAPQAVPAPPPIASVPRPAPAPPDYRAPASLLTEFERYREARRFMNESVVNALGLKSIFFTQQIEKTGNLEDLREILADYQRTMAKALGAKVAAGLVAQLNTMLDA